MSVFVYRLSIAGKNKYLSLGLDDTSENRRIAEAKAKQIESDIIYERFAPSLAKYRPEHFKLDETKDETKILSLLKNAIEF